MNGKVTSPRASTPRRAKSGNFPVEDDKTDAKANQPTTSQQLTPRRVQPTKISDVPSSSSPVNPAAAAGDATGTAAAATARAPLQYHHTAYVERERIHMEREKNGETTASYIWNSGEKSNEQNCVLLCKLVGIFSKCLPNMPRTYISRLVFDRRHRSVIIRRKNGRVVAGITYRPFHDRRFAEIAFCAVAQTLQVSGFGTRLMNWTKYYAREMDQIEYFLTYADNAAVGYFAKQGFTKHQSMAKDRWFGYIKDYDGGTLMECYIHPILPYSRLPEMIAEQKKALEADVWKLLAVSEGERESGTPATKKKKGQAMSGGVGSTASAGPLVVYPSLTSLGYFAGSDAAPATRVGVLNRKVVENLQDIPGVIEAGWTAESHAMSQPSFRIRLPQSGRLVDPTPSNLRQFETMLLDVINKEETLVWPFREAVDAKLVPDYYVTIKDPVDIGMLRRNIAGGLYVTLDLFVADVRRMFRNAKLFNGPESEYSKAAMKLMGMFDRILAEHCVYDLDVDQK